MIGHTFNKALCRCACGWRADPRSTAHWEAQWAEHLNFVKAGNVNDDWVKWVAARYMEGIGIEGDALVLHSCLCLLCGALVDVDQLQHHVVWHERQDRHVHAQNSSTSVTTGPYDKD